MLKIYQCKKGDLGVAVTGNGFFWHVQVCASIDHDWRVWDSPAVDVIDKIVEVIDDRTVWVPELRKFVNCIDGHMIELCSRKVI